MKILPFIARGTSYYLKMSVKKLVPFLVVGLMLAASDSVYAYSGGNGSIARGDDYPAYYKNGSQEIDQWRMYSRQCTSFAAFRLSSVNGFEIPRAYGNANEWGHRARREGYRVDNTPTIGSIAWSTAGTYGHVAWVSNVMGDQIEIEEYNYGYTEAYNKRSIKANTMTGFIHFKDLDGGNVVSSGKVFNSQPSSTGGTHYFKNKAAIKNQPLVSATSIAYYSPGESVHYDQILEKDGYKWLSYTAYNGSRRYIQLEGVASSQNYQNQSGNSSNYSSNTGLPVGWKKINGSWYHFKSNGSKSTGWLKDGSSWYYLKSSGEMQTGWLKENGSWYYLDSSGAMKTGWYQVSGKWYYSYSSGALAVNTTVDGYRVNSDGERV